MLFVGCCLGVLVCCSHLHPAGCCLMFAVRSLFAVCCVLSDVRCVLVVVRFVLFVVCWLRSVLCVVCCVCCSLCVVCCVLFDVVVCLLFV